MTGQKGLDPREYALFSYGGIGITVCVHGRFSSKVTDSEYRVPTVLLGTGAWARQRVLLLAEPATLLPYGGSFMPTMRFVAHIAAFLPLPHIDGTSYTRLLRDQPMLIVLTVLILFVATLAHTIFGFGSALVAMPLLVLTVGVQ